MKIYVVIVRYDDKVDHVFGVYETEQEAKDICELMNIGFVEYRYEEFELGKAKSRVKVKEF